MQEQPLGNTGPFQDLFGVHLFVRVVFSSQSTVFEEMDRSFGKGERREKKKEPLAKEDAEVSRSWILDIRRNEHAGDGQCVMDEKDGATQAGFVGDQARQKGEHGRAHKRRCGEQ